MIEQTYDEIAHHFAAILREENGFKEEIAAVDEFLSLFPDKEKCRILDLGCGVGKHGRYCAEKGFKVTGLDISKNMIRLANEYNNDENYAKIDALQIADMCDFQTDEKFDGVISFYSFIHLTNEQAKKALNNLKKHLKKDAIIAISVYKGNRNGFCPDSLPEKGKRNLLLYFKDYQLDEFKNLLSETSFTVMKVKEWSDFDPITTTDKVLDSDVLFFIARYDG